MQNNFKDLKKYKKKDSDILIIRKLRKDFSDIITHTTKSYSTTRLSHHIVMCKVCLTASYTVFGVNAFVRHKIIASIEYLFGE